MSAYSFPDAVRTRGEKVGTSAFEHDLIAALTMNPHRISPKYFYDARGSELFDRICELPEYYLTRAERSIFAEYAKEMARAMGEKVELIEFGAGSLEKVRLLLDAFPPEAGPVSYVPIDISGAYLGAAASELRTAYPSLAVSPMVADYTEPIFLPNCPPGRRRVGFFPGSTLGNFEPEDALSFLTSAARLLSGGGMLIGVDLVKDPAELHAAYNDADGVTAEFNRNLLVRANRELGADFQPDLFAHYAFYSPSLRRVEMHLVSVRAQVVSLRGRRFYFGEGDSLHTESSHKYTLTTLDELARTAGFRPGPAWFDERHRFCVQWLEAPARDEAPPGSEEARLRP